MSNLSKTLVDILTLSPETTILSLIILVSALFLYLFWYFPEQKALLKGLNSVSNALEKENISVDKIKSEILDDIPSDSYLIKESWLETEKRIVKINQNDNQKYVMYGIPRDIWNPSTLLSKRFNLSLAESVPNLLVGVGLFFTFLFLSLALVEATTALTEASSSQDTEDAISQLLKLAGSKFLTSLVSLFASICWTIALRHSLNKTSLACERLLSALKKIIPPTGSEDVLSLQLDTNEKKLTASENSNFLTEELLEEAREQTGTFKRFETDLAVSLAGAINQAFTPQMQAMTEQLVDALEGLSNKLGTMNQEALKSMMDDFSAMLYKSTKDEMTQLQQTLQELTQNLHGAGTNFENQSEQAAASIQSAGAQLAQYTQEMSEKMIESTSHLQEVTASIKLGFKELEIIIDDAANQGRAGITQVNDVLNKTEEAVAQLNQVAMHLTSTSQDLTATSLMVSDVVTNVKELAHEQQAVVSAVKEVAPSAMTAVERVTNVLDHAAEQTLSSMQQTRQIMESTVESLEKVVGSITEGVGVYSSQVAELHRQMDAQLAKAVGNFDQGVKDLADVVEDLTEVMQPV